MTMLRAVGTGALALCVSALSACVDSPGVTSPADVYDPLAETFDALSREAAVLGDLARSDGFAFAALSVRSGVAPSPLQVQTGNVTEQYDAFVSGAQWETSLPVALRPPARRSLVGWRKTNEGTTRVIALSVPSDSAAIMSPVSLGSGTSTVAVYNAASAMQNDGRDNAQGHPDLSDAWFATSGWVKLREVLFMGACADSARVVNKLGVARCEEGRYEVRFDLTMQRLSGRPPQVVNGLPSRHVMTVAETVVNGLRLRFTCTSPDSARGCKTLSEMVSP